ncbi:MAG: MBL fold metallo-hydrolase [Paludibacter sp.]|nr:MBL fold metallo-hydrolase [Paludibacter sp.]
MDFKKILIIWSVLFAHSFLNSAKALNPKLEITYIANEGYLITTSQHKILVDALFTESYGVFDTPSKDTLNAIMNGIAPFDSINLYFLTHYHKDHCNPAMVYKYLRKFQNIQLVTNKPALVFIDGDQFGFISCKKQFIELTPELNRSLSKSVDGVNITAHSIKHLPYIKNGIDLEEYMYNTAYTIETDGVRIFHSGDVDFNNLKAYFDNDQNSIPNVDIAFMYYGLLSSSENLKYITEKLNPKKIILMHVPLKKYDEWESKTKQLKSLFPGIYFLKSSN